MRYGDCRALCDFLAEPCENMDMFMFSWPSNLAWLVGAAGSFAATSKSFRSHHQLMRWLQATPHCLTQLTPRSCVGFSLR